MHLEQLNLSLSVRQASQAKRIQRESRKTLLSERGSGFTGQAKLFSALRSTVAMVLAMVAFVCVSQAAEAQGYVFPASVNVGVTSAVETVTVKITTAGTLNMMSALTSGANALDYSMTAGSCAIGTAYAVGQTCTVNVSLTPKLPGIRSGAILLQDSGNNPLATQLLYGVGVGPLSVLTSGEITSIAGDGHLSDGGADGTPATMVSIHEPLGVAVDGAGDTYYTDNGNNRIDMVDTAGNFHVVAGNGIPGFSPDGTPAVSANLNGPAAIVLDGAGNVYFTEEGNFTVREVVKVSGLIRTIAGTGTSGYSGDGGLATAATLNQAEGLAFDSAGNLFIADTQNNVIRKVSVLDGTISTYAGSIMGNTGDGGPAASALFNEPWGIFAASDGSLYIADLQNCRIRRITAAGIVSTVAGTGIQGNTGDKAAALQAELDHPADVVLDAAGDLYISDSDNNVIRKVNGASKVITTIAGSGGAISSGDGTDADGMTVGMNKPFGLALDGSGNLFIADRLGLKIREVYSAVAVLDYANIKVTNTSPPQTQGLDNDGNAALTLSSITPVSNAVVTTATTCPIGTPLAVAATCVVSIEFKPTTVGSPVLGQVTVESDSPNSPVTINLSGNSLSIEPTTTTLVSSANPSYYSQAVTFTATVASAGATLTGTVEFLDGTTVLSTQILSSTTRVATYTTGALTVGSHPITAVYSGDNSNQTSTSTPTPLNQIVKQFSSVTLSTSGTPAAVFSSVTFTAIVSEIPTGGSVPTGSVVFYDGGSLLPNDPITITNGVATYTTALLAVGTHNITATYSGDTNNQAGGSNPITQVITLAPATISLTTSNATVLLTVPVTFTATIAGTPTSEPTGTVVFKDGTTVIGSMIVTPTGTASLTISTLAAGTHSITATYSGDTDYTTSTSAAIIETVQKIATTAALVSSANPAVAGATVNFTVTITGANTTTPNVPITGTVTLMDGATVLGTGMVTAAGAGPAVATITIPVSTLSATTHAITAIYAGDANYIGSQSGALVETVGLASTTTTLATSATIVIITKPVTLTATVTSNGGTPTGSIQFVDGTVLLGTGTLTNGVATLTISTLGLGVHTIKAVYSGDAKDAVSTSNLVTITVNAATTTTALTPSQSPTSFGQPFTLTARVTGTGGIPTGSVTFTDGATTLQTAVVNAGVATFTTSTLAIGSHTFTATYSGDADDTGSVSPTLTVVVLQTVSLTLTSNSPNPSIARSNVHFIATITPQQGLQPTGSITFKDGGTTLGTGLISGTTATFDTAALAVGTHSITAVYPGDAGTAAATSAPYAQIINAAGASVTLVTSANPSTFGKVLTFTATATSTAGALTGTVKFQDGGVTIGTGALSSTGVASFSTSTLAAGNHNIVAAYQGDSDDSPASSSTLLQVVERATSTAITSSQNPLPTLTPVTFTATVSTGTSAAATGTITFAEDSVVIATVPVNASGVATYQFASLSAGTHNIIATYSGDAVDFASVSTALSEVVQLRPTTDSLTTSATSLTGGQQITLISIVRWTGATTPTGTVTFYNGTLVLATAPVDGTGTATVTVLIDGTSANLSSAYSGDAFYAGSVSTPQLVTIGPAPDFTLTATPTNFTLVTKQYATLAISLASVKDFTDTISLGCLGMPLAATCTFSNNQQVLTAGGVINVTLNVDTGDPLLGGSQARNESPTASKLVLACFLPGGLLLGLIGLRFRKVKGIGGLLLLLCLAGISTALTGCGTVSMTSTPPGTYTFNISAVGRTGVSQTLPVTMIVTK